MGDLSAFLAENAEKMDMIEVVISNRFKDSDGNPVSWKLKPLSAKEDEAIRKACTYREPVKGRRGQYNDRLDSDEYVKKLAAACVVFPNLADAELQNSYGVEGAGNLLVTMLSSGEMARLLNTIQDLNGMNEDFEDKVDEVKNA